MHPMLPVLLALALPLAPKAPPAADGPLDFRCDTMQVHSKPNRTICIGNVIVRRPDVLLCCQSFEGTADDKWQWQKLVCTGDVRAQRGDERMWATQAEFIPTPQDLVLTGTPSVQRGESILFGDKVIANVRDERARITKPRGQFVDASKKPTPWPALPLKGELPAVCPLPAAPTEK